MKIAKFLVIIVTFTLWAISQLAFAWDGYDYEKGTYVEIDEGNLVREGETIEIYDYEDGEYKDVEVESVDNDGSSVEVEVYDPDTGETRTLDMEE